MGRNPGCQVHIVVNGKWLYTPRAIALGVRRGCIFTHLLIYLWLFVYQYKVINTFYWGLGDVIKCCASMLDRTGALIGEQRSSRYCEGVLSVVVFEISLSYVKTFHYRPHRSQPPPDPTRTRCATSLRWLCFRQVCRPSYLVQVQSPISTAQKSKY